MGAVLKPRPGEAAERASKVLVTGAAGFIGRRVVAALRAGGREVRALVRPGGDAGTRAWDAGVEVVRADLCGAEDLTGALKGVDVVIHLAARRLGEPDEQRAVAVDGTRRLLAAMSRGSVRRVVLASSFAVYDWHAVGEELTETSPLAAAGVGDGYAAAKIQQEELVRGWCRERGWPLTVLRPGFVWGAGRAPGDPVGRRLGPLLVVVGPRRRPPLTYVENCADAFVAASGPPAASERIFNVVDDHDVTAWRCAAQWARRAGGPRLRLAVPYAGTLRLLVLAEIVARRLGGRRGLPGVLARARFEAQFKPVRCAAAAARRELGWAPRFGFEQALARALPAPEATAGRLGAGR